MYITFSHFQLFDHPLYCISPPSKLTSFNTNFTVSLFFILCFQIFQSRATSTALLSQIDIFFWAKLGMANRDLIFFCAVFLGTTWFSKSESYFSRGRLDFPEWNFLISQGWLDFPEWYILISQGRVDFLEWNVLISRGQQDRGRPA